MHINEDSVKFLCINAPPDLPKMYDAAGDLHPEVNVD